METYKEETAKKELGIPKDDKLRIFKDDFIATEWKWDKKKQRFYCLCFEKLGNKWEGFISIKSARYNIGNPKNRIQTTYKTK